MRRLLHMPFDPASRMVRIALAEKGLPVDLEENRPWDAADAIAAVNPSGSLPVLVDHPVDSFERRIAPASVILDYLEDQYPEPALFPKTPADRAEARRLICWFTQKFEAEVVTHIVRERIDKRLMRCGQPDYDMLRAGIEALDWHMDYLAWLLDQRDWLVGESYCAADIAAAGYLSSIDYVDGIAWRKYPTVKDWYARIKSRPALRPVLADRIPGMPPPRHFTDPDF